MATNLEPLANYEVRTITRRACAMTSEVISSEVNPRGYWVLGSLIVLPWPVVFAGSSSLLMAIFWDAIVLGFTGFIWYFSPKFEIENDVLRHRDNFGRSSSLAFHEMTGARIIPWEGEWASRSFVPYPMVEIEGHDGPPILIDPGVLTLRSMASLFDALEEHEVPIGIADFWLARRFETRLLAYRAANGKAKLKYAPDEV